MTPQSPSKGPWRLAVGGAALLMVAGIILFALAIQRNQGAQTSGAVKVSVGAQACEPNALKVNAGKTVFEIHNTSERAVEWEILDGVMVVEERENILPGFTQTLTAQLQPGSYQMTCGLLTNPRGAIEVAAVAGAGASKEVNDKAFLGALSEYTVYLRLQAKALATSTQKLADAIGTGDLEQAKGLYLQSRLAYAKIVSIMLRFSDAEATISPVADFLEKREDDPAFIGFHRIEYGLFNKGSTNDLKPFADKLVADVNALNDRLRALKLSPADLAGNAGKLASRLAERQVPRGENLYAHSDLEEFDSDLAGLAKLALLLKPILSPVAADVASAIDTKLAAAQAELTKYRTGDSFPSYQTVDEKGRKALADAFSALSGEFAKVNGALGL